MRKNTYKSVKIVISTVLCLSALLLSSCGNGKAPLLEDVKDTFENLIEQSFEVNDIFFGSGLPVYDRETSSGDGNAKYDEASKTYYSVLPDDKYGSVLKYFGTDRQYRYAGLTGTGKNAIPASGLDFSADGFVTLNENTEYRTFAILTDYIEPDRPIVYDENSPKYYDYVLVDCPYQSVDEIKAAADAVYSRNYLDSVYVIMFDGYATGTSIVYARYMLSESGDFFMKSNRFDPYFTEQTEYDYSSMKIVKPSNASFVNVEISARGYRLNPDTLESELQTYTRNLRFTRTGTEWRLDTPTY